MRLLDWNYQRLGNRWTVHSLCKIVRDLAPIVCFLMETRLDGDGFNSLCGDLPFPNLLVVKQPNLGGGLALIWKEDVKIDLINFTLNHILVKVIKEDGFEWFLTCFYGWLDANQQA